MMATVKFLSHMAETCGTGQMQMEGMTVDLLLHALSDRFGPEFDRKLKTCKVLVNGRSVTALALGRTPLTAQDEVTLLPPIAGG